VIGGTPPRACRGTSTGACEKVVAQGSGASAGPGSSSALPGTRPAALAVALGTTWESPALATALCRAVLLACARAVPAETWKCPGCGDVDAFLGVKGSPVQIRPSRRVFRTLVPRSGNENCHDHSHLTGRDEQSIQDGGHAILMTALPPWPGSPA